MKVEAKPMNKKLWTKGFTIGVIIIAIGLVFTIVRFTAGIGAVTNLSDGVPWGLWITFDVVTGVALAAGGFTMAALVYIFNGGKFSPLLRPALITALLGYGVAVIAIVLDVGRWWQIYNPLLPSSWQGNSPLFEVSLCVMTYFTVLLLEFVPIAHDKWGNKKDGFFAKIVNFLAPFVNKILIFLIILGVVLSTLHQSSLGAVMLIAFERIHPLWHSPWLPAFFLISAVAIGYPMVIIESTLSARTFNTKSETHLLSKIAKYTPYFLGIYIGLKIFDLAYYGEFGLLLSGWGVLFIVENLLIAIIPFFLLIKKSVRASQHSLFLVSIMMVFGLILNRFNTYLITYSPRPGFDYFPSLGEFFITAMMIAIVFVGYKLLANYFPILPREESGEHYGKI